jgi:hypothetical protein
MLKFNKIQQAFKHDNQCDVFSFLDRKNKIHTTFNSYQLFKQFLFIYSD